MKFKVTKTAKQAKVGSTAAIRYEDGRPTTNTQHIKEQEKTTLVKQRL